MHALLPLSAVVSLCLALSLPSCTPARGRSFEVDSLTYERSWTLENIMENDPLGGRSHFYVKIDYPVSSSNGLTAVADSVRLWLSSRLLPAGSEPVANKSVLDVAANIFFGENDGNEWGEEASISLRMVFESSDFLTYEASRYTYSGGAHGNYYICGATFRKDDGRRLTWNDFPKSDELRKALTADLRESLRLGDIADMVGKLLLDKADYTLADGSIAVPLPTVEPWLTDTGWVFTYQPYEILPWSYGAPACCIKELKLAGD